MHLSGGGGGQGEGASIHQSRPKHLTLQHAHDSGLSESAANFVEVMRSSDKSPIKPLLPGYPNVYTVFL